MSSLSGGGEALEIIPPMTTTPIRKKTRTARTQRQHKAKRYFVNGGVMGDNVDEETKRQWWEARLDRLENSYDLILGNRGGGDENDGGSDFEADSDSSESESGSDMDDLDEKGRAESLKMKKAKAVAKKKKANKAKSAKAKAKKEKATKKKGGAKAKKTKTGGSSSLLEDGDWQRVMSLSTALLECRDSIAVERYIRADAVEKEPIYPSRHFCPVTALPGIYRDKRSGIRFSGSEALEQLREREPPWMTGAGGGGDACYYEACKTLKRYYNVSGADNE